MAASGFGGTGDDDGYRLAVVVGGIGHEGKKFSVPGLEIDPPVTRANERSVDGSGLWFGILPGWGRLFHSRVDLAETRLGEINALQ